VRTKSWQSASCDKLMIEVVIEVSLKPFSLVRLASIIDFLQLDCTDFDFTSCLVSMVDGNVTTT
jgi:hypothetical protein